MGAPNKAGQEGYAQWPMANSSTMNDAEVVNTPFCDGLSVTNPVRTCQRRSFKHLLA